MVGTRSRSANHWRPGSSAVPFETRAALIYRLWYPSITQRQVDLLSVPLLRKRADDCGLAGMEGLELVRALIWL